ncbi:MAG: hypothetical protein JRG96_06880 [Deltaproteobacteria bacterium]|nr:hypothetical protein [Deltaproteobacteria bacterium]
MDATFFTAQRPAAMSVSAWDDIPDEPAAEALRIPDPGALTALGKLLCGEGKTLVAPLRDATCRSFPVWSFDPALSRRIAELDDTEIDGLAERWQRDPGCAGMEGDLYELSTLLADLREALRQRPDSGEELFVLLEQKAL